MDLHPEWICSLLSSASPSGFNFCPCTPTSKIHQIHIPCVSLCCFIAISMASLSPCWGRAPYHESLHTQNCSCNEFSITPISLSKASVSLLNMKGHAIFFCTSTNLIGQADYGKNRMGENTVHQVHRRYIKLTPPAACCPSLVSWAAAATAGHSLPESHW